MMTHLRSFLTTLALIFYILNPVLASDESTDALETGELTKIKSTILSEKQAILNDMFEEDDELSSEWKVDLIGACTNPFIVNGPYPYNTTGTTAGKANHCALRANPDQSYRVTIPCDGNWEFSLCGPATNYDTYLFLTNTCCGTAIAVNDDACGLDSRIQTNLTAGTYFLLVDGFSGSGAYELDICELDNPTVSAPGAQNVSANGNCQYILPNYIGNGTVTSADNCNIGSFIQSPAPGVAIGLGPTTVSFTATDNCGNAAMSSFVVTVTDNANPTVASCPTNMTVSTGLSSCNAVVTYTAPTFNDNCDGTGQAGTLSAGLASGATFPLGTTPVSYTYTDGAGNGPITCSFSVTVVDDVDPVATGCPANITVPATSGCSAVVTYTAPNFNDNCDGNGQTGTLTSGLASGSTFTGTSTVTYSYTDAAGNGPITCSFTVTVIDDTNPTAVGCPSNISVPADPTACSATVTYTAPTFNDNCDGNGLSGALQSGLPSGAIFPVGVTTVTYDYTDAAGNGPTVCTFTVTVIDDTAPSQASCPMDITMSADMGACSASVTYTVPTFNDNCDGNSVVGTLTAGLASGATFPVGSTPVSYTYTDMAGNGPTTCAFTVTVEDNEIPVFSNCPMDMTVSSNAIGCTANVTWTAPTASDNCAISSVNSTHNSGDVFSAGVTTVTYTADDVNGNSEVCSFTITIEDTESPVFSSEPADVTVTCINSAPGDPGITASDNCDSPIMVNFSQYIPSSCEPDSMVINTWTAMDNSGNPVSYSQNVTILDVTAPTLSSNPADVTVDCYSDVPGDPGLSATDDCGATLTVNYSQGVAPACAGAGTVTNTWEATDCAGNVFSYTQTVTITDNQMPVLSATPADITVDCSSDIPGAQGLTATDNCGETLTVTHSQSGAPACAGDGIVVNTWVVIDCAGNVTSHTQDVTIADPTGPVFSSTPADVTVDCIGDVPGDPGLTATDNCGGSPSVTYSQGTAPACQGSGTITNTWDAMDCAGNISTHVQTVTLLDNIAPVLSATPAPVTVTCATDAPGDPGVTATDNCGETITVVFMQNAGTGCTGDSIVTNTWTAVDCAGNMTTYDQEITLLDNIAPTFSATPADVTVNCAADVPGDPGVTALDNCGDMLTVLFEQTPALSNCPDSSAVINRWSVFDCAGNLATHEQTVTIDDAIGPVFSAMPADITVACEADIVPDTMITATDNCGDSITVIFTQVLPGTCPGVATHTWEATDCAGNTSTHVQTIAVNDTIPPLLFVPADTLYSCDSILPPPNAIPTDNCSNGLTVNFSEISGTGCMYTIERMWDVEDECGNMTVATQTITVQDITAPDVIFMPADTVIYCDSQAVTWLEPIATDYCSDTVFVNQVLGPANGAVFPVGTTEIAYEFIDDCNNMFEQSFFITIDSCINDVYEDPDSACANAIFGGAGIIEANNLLTPGGSLTGLCSGFDLSNAVFYAIEVSHDGPVTISIPNASVDSTISHLEVGLYGPMLDCDTFPDPNATFVACDSADITNGESIYINHEDALEGEIYIIMVSGTGKGRFNIGIGGLGAAIEEVILYGQRTGKREHTLTWFTRTEVDNDIFYLQRSLDSINWVNLSDPVTAGGTHPDTIYYNYVDESAELGYSYYRVQVIDYDGDIAYSNTIHMELTCPHTFYPNPTTGDLTIFYTSPFNEEVAIDVINDIGQVLYTETYYFTHGPNFVNLSLDNLADAPYIIRVRHQFSGLVVHEKILKLSD